MGNEYIPNREIDCTIKFIAASGFTSSKAAQRGEKLKVSVFVGGPPAHTFAAVMPLPEGLSELMFAGMLAGRNFRYARDEKGHFISADVDFVITGTIDPSATKPEGPFGDHLGYYSLTHDFPVMEVDAVYHREGAIWPFTAVATSSRGYQLWAVDSCGDGSYGTRLGPRASCHACGGCGGGTPALAGHRQ